MENKMPINDASNQPSALVVEDERDYAELLAAILEDGGFAVDYAVDGLDALERVKAKKPDVITLDVQMPRKSGIQFYRELKSNPIFKEIPVVVVTGITKDDRDMETFVRTFLETEHLPLPDGFLEKPVDNDEFPKTITVDYSEGCVGRMGLAKKGTLTIEMSDTITNEGAVYKVTFSNVKFGNRSIETTITYTNEGQNF